MAEINEKPVVDNSQDINKITEELMEDINRDERINEDDRLKYKEILSRFETDKGTAIEQTKEDLKKLTQEQLKNGFEITGKNSQELINLMLKFILKEPIDFDINYSDFIGIVKLDERGNLIFEENKEISSSTQSIVETQTQASIEPISKVENSEKQKIDEAKFYNVTRYNPEEIELIQEIVKTTVDGKVGPKTIEAIKEYQENKGLTKVDGKVGKETLGRMSGETNSLYEVNLDGEIKKIEKTEKPTKEKPAAIPTQVTAEIKSTSEKPVEVTKTLESTEKPLQSAVEKKLKSDINDFLNIPTTNK